MNKQNIEAIIIELASQLYSDANALEMSAWDVAKGYFDNRLENEIERDERAGVEIFDYLQWAQKGYEIATGKPYPQPPAQTQDETMAEFDLLPNN